MSGSSPGEQTYQTILEDKDDSYACIEAAEIVGHDSQTESRSTDII